MYRVLKEHRAAGILENFSEGEKYKEHALRKYVRNRAPEVMPSLNKFFSDPELPNWDDHSIMIAPFHLYLE